MRTLILIFLFVFNASSGMAAGDEKVEKEKAAIVVGETPSSEEGEIVKPETLLPTPDSLATERRLIELEWRLLDREAETINWWLAYVIGFLSLIMTASLVGFAFVGVSAKRILDDMKDEAGEVVDKIKSHEETAQTAVGEIVNAQDIAENKNSEMIISQSTDNNPHTASIIALAVAQAHDLQRKGDMQAARVKWQNIADLTDGIDPKIASSAWLSVGYFWQEQYKLDGVGYEEAFNAYSRAIELALTNAPAFSNRGGFRANADELDEGNEDLDKAILLDPNYHQSFAARGVLKNTRHDFVEAIKDFNRALELAPDAVEYYGGRVVANQALGNSELAMEDLDRSLLLNPNYAHGYALRGYIKQETGDDDGAFSDFSAAILNDPSLFSAYLIRAYISIRSGRTDELLSDVKNIVRLKDASSENNLLVTENSSRSSQVTALINNLEEMLKNLLEKDEKKAAGLIQACLDELSK